MPAEIGVIAIAGAFWMVYQAAKSERALGTRIGTTLMAIGLMALVLAMRIPETPSFYPFVASSIALMVVGVACMVLGDIAEWVSRVRSRDDKAPLA